MEIWLVGGSSRRNCSLLCLANGDSFTNYCRRNCDVLLSWLINMQYDLLVQGPKAILVALLSNSVVVEAQIMISC